MLNELALPDSGIYSASTVSSSLPELNSSALLNSSSSFSSPSGITGSIICLPVSGFTESFQIRKSGSFSENYFSLILPSMATELVGSSAPPPLLVPG